jgi:hypothetical protein
MTLSEREAAEERGHRMIHCRRHNYHGWSDDCGMCPYCEPEAEPEEDEEDEDDDER